MNQQNTEQALRLFNEAQRLMFEQGDPFTALARLEQAIPLLFRLVFVEDRHPLLFQYAHATGLRVLIRYQLGDRQGALKEYQQHIEKLWDFIDRGGDYLGLRQPLAETHTTLGTLHLMQGEHDQAQALFDKAIDLLEEKAAPGKPPPLDMEGGTRLRIHFEPVDPRLLQGELARAYGYKGTSYMDTHDLPQAQGYLTRAVELLEPLAAEPSPGNNIQDICKDNLATFYANEARLKLKRGRRDQARELFHKGLSLLEGRSDAVAVNMRESIRAAAAQLG